MFQILCRNYGITGSYEFWSFLVSSCNYLFLTLGDVEDMVFKLGYISFFGFATLQLIQWQRLHSESFLVNKEIHHSVLALLLKNKMSLWHSGTIYVVAPWWPGHNHSVRGTRQCFVVEAFAFTVCSIRCGNLCCSHILEG